MLAGCASSKNNDRSPVAGDTTGTAALSMSQAGRSSADEPKDAPPPLSLVFQVDVYQLAVPFGTFSDNEPFWRRVNEQCVDVGTYDLLYKNGIRVGEAPLGELKEFRKYIAEVTPAQRLTVTATEVRNVEVPMKKDLPEQAIFYFDGANQVIGHSFERSENVISIAFQPTPRRPGHLRLTICPVVRSQKKVLQAGPRNDTREFEFVHPERMYELNMKVDIPRESFLIVTASNDAARPTSVGRAFLTLDAPAERMEQVLLILPKPYVAEPPAVGTLK